MSKPTQLLGVTKTSQEALNCKRSSLQGSELLHVDLKVTSVKKQTPLMNRVYSLRSKVCHKAVLCGSKSSMEGCRQLILLGAGLDTSYDGHSDFVFAVDFKEVLYTRCRDSDAKPVAGDLTQFDDVWEKLCIVGLDVTKPTIILLECVSCYIHEHSVTKLLNALVKRLVNAMVVLYDPCLQSEHTTTHQLSSTMRRKFAERGAPLFSCKASATAISERLHQAEWSHVCSITMSQAASLWLSPAERQYGSTGGVTSSAEPFDEFASLAALNNHYVVTIASNNADWFRNTLCSLSEWSLNGTAPAGSNNGDCGCLMGVSIRPCERSEGHSVTPDGSSNASITADSSSRLPGVCVEAATGVTLREASSDDSAVIVKLYSEEFEAMAAQYASVRRFVKSNLKPLSSIDSHFARESGSRFFVAVATDSNAGGSGETVVGSVGVRVVRDYRADKSAQSATAVAPEDEKCIAELSHLCVSGAYRRRGVGRALVLQAVDSCRALGAKVSRIELTLLCDLVAARKLYGEFGFEHVERQDLGNGCCIDRMVLQMTT